MPPPPTPTGADELERSFLTLAATFSTRNPNHPAGSSGLLDPTDRWLFRDRFGAAHAAIIRGTNFPTDDESLTQATRLHLEHFRRTCSEWFPTRQFRDLNDDQLRFRVNADYLARALAVCAARSPRWPAEPELLRSAYLEARRSWESRQLKYICCVPLIGLTAWSAIPFDNGLTLAHPSMADRYLWAPSREFHPPGNPFGPTPSSVLKGTVVADSDDRDGNFVREVVRKVTDTLVALRLAAKGRFGALPIHLTPAPEHDADPRTSSYVYNVEFLSHPAWVVPLPVLVDDDIASRAKALAPAVSRAFETDLGLALERFNWAYTRSTPEDSIIDLTIALEGTLLFGIKDELRYRLSLRGAALLAELRQPQVVLKTLRSLYDVRSQLVHHGRKLEQCDESGATSQERRAFVDEAFGVASEVVRLYVVAAESGRGPTAVCEGLDEKIIRALRPIDSVAGQPDPGTSPTAAARRATG